jgi:L-aminopeptidase/D-esterase-like protein
MVSSITDVPGIRVGQAEDVEALTGCTVVLCDEGTVAGVDQRGGAPGTRETDLLQPMHMVEHVHAVMLAGGSAYGLDAASGVMKFLEENEVGFDTGYAKVPVVPGAILFDLGLGSAIVRPDAEMGYKACQNATKNAPSEGNHGAGTGASVGKILGMANAVKSGIGSSCIALSDDVFVGALIAVNAIGDILDPYSGELLAGPRGESGTSFLSTTDILKSMLGANPQSPVASQNTVIGVVATNATLSKEAANKVAQMAHNGFARAIRPAHSMFDGDTIFSLATCKHPA